MAKKEGNKKQAKPRKKAGEKPVRKKITRKKAGTKTGVAEKHQRVHSAPPADLTWELIEEVCETVAQGNFRHVAIQRAGIHSERFKRWMSSGVRDLKLFAKGELDELNMYCHLVVEMERAEGEAHQEILQDVLLHGDPSTKLKFLQLRYQKLYNKNPNSLNDEDGTIVKVRAKDLLLDLLGGFLDSEELPPNP